MNETLSKDELLFQFVDKQLQKRKEMSQMESIEGVVSKMPRSRIIKQSQNLVFDEVKHSVENTLSKEEFRRIKKIEESKSIRAIVFKMTKQISDFSIKNEEVIKQEKLKSKQPIENCVRYLKNQDMLKLDVRIGRLKNTYSEVEYIRIGPAIELENTKLFLKDAEVRKLYTYFQNDYVIQFKNNILPNEFQLEKRAEVLAKLYLVDLYKSQIPRMEQQLKTEEEQRLKQLELDKMKKKIEEERLKHEKEIKEEDITENDLIKQVRKIQTLLEKRLNALAYEHFVAKRFEESVIVKKSLEKLKKTVKQTPVVLEKLKFLIKYKQQKNY